jgi:hypothetical protein
MEYYCLYKKISLSWQGSLKFSIRSKCEDALAMKIVWLNFGILIISSLMFLTFYAKVSVEKQFRASAYQRWATYRLISSIFMTIAAVNYIILVSTPLPLPQTFAWSWWLSAAIAAFIAIPSLYLTIRWRGSHI